MVPGVRYALPVHAEHAGGKGVQLPGPRLDVVLRVVLGPTIRSCEAIFKNTAAFLFFHCIKQVLLYVSISLIYLDDDASM